MKQGVFPGAGGHSVSGATHACDVEGKVAVSPKETGRTVTTSQSSGNHSDHAVSSAGSPQLCSEQLVPLHILRQAAAEKPKICSRVAKEGGRVLLKDTLRLASLHS